MVRTYFWNPGEKSTVSRENARDITRKARAQPGSTLRHVTFPWKVQWPLGRYDGLLVEDADIAGLMFGSRFWGKLFPTIVTGATFRRTVLGPAHCVNTQFSRCNFESTSCGGDFMALFWRCRFVGCTFDQCEIGATSFLDCSFRDCEFRDATISHSDMKGCELANVRIHGRATRFSLFDVSGSNLDLSELELHEFLMMNTALQSFRPPEQLANFILDVPALQHAHLDSLTNDLAEAVRQVGERYRRSKTLIYEDINSVLEEVPKTEREIVRSTLFSERIRPDGAA